MIKTSNNKSIIIPENVSRGHVWWINNPITDDNSKENNLIMKNRPFLILNVEPSYSTYKVNGIMLQSRHEYMLSRYEYPLGVLPNGKYSIADVSNITTINIEDLTDYMYEVNDNSMKIINRILDTMSRSHYVKAIGQVWQYDNKDYLIIKDVSTAYDKHILSLLEIKQRTLDELDFSDVVIHSCSDDKYNVVTIGTEIKLRPHELSVYKYSITDFSIGKVTEAITKVNRLGMIMKNNPIMKQLASVLNTCTPPHQNMIRKPTINNNDSRQQRKSNYSKK